MCILKSFFATNALSIQKKQSKLTKTYKYYIFIDYIFSIKNWEKFYIFPKIIKYVWPPFPSQNINYNF